MIDWLPNLEANRYTVRTSEDGRDWRIVREVTSGAGGRDWLALPDTDARYVRFDLRDGPNWRYGIRDIALKPLAFAATPNAFLSSVAADLPRGSLPRAYVGEQPYWTLLGLDGGQEQALISEDGALEPAKGSFSIEPFIRPTASCWTGRKWLSLSRCRITTCRSPPSTGCMRRPDSR